MANTIRLKRGTTEPTAENLVTGELAINTGDATVYTKLDDGTVSTIVGKSNNLFVAVRNESGSTIPAGSAVYISGASNGKPLITLAQANSEASSSKTLGLTVASIATNANGEVIATGLLTKIDTQAYAAGDVLWLSPTVAGGFTTTKPSAPNHAVFIGTVLSSASNGKIEVKVQNGFELQELHNVSISGLADKDIISYNSSTGLYENQTATELGLAPLSNPTFTGDVTASQNLVSNFSSGDEGGEIKLATAQTNSVLVGGSVTIDINQSQIRFFETGGTNRGAYINLASAASGVGTNLLAAGSGGSSTWGSITGTLSSQTDLQNALNAKAPLASPTFTGTVTIPAGASISGFAPLASPTFTGTPLAPTASAGTNTTQLATTAFVTTAISTKANLASPALTGTPTAPTATAATNTTQIATTAYVKTNLASYATLASPTFTGVPNAPTASSTVENTQIASTGFVKGQLRKTPSYMTGSMDSILGALNENAVYMTATNNLHNVALSTVGYYNTTGAVIMFRQSDDSQLAFTDQANVSAPNTDRYYAAFPGAVIFAVKSGSSTWFIYGDLISTQHTPYGTVISGPTIDTVNTVYSGYQDYYGNNVNAYTVYNTIANGWGGQTTSSTTPSVGTVMSDNFTYSASTDTYNLLADGIGGYTLNFVSSSGGGYDPYGTKVGTPYWDGSYNALYQVIADGNGGTTSVSWDGMPPYPVYGTQVSTTSYNNSGYRFDQIGNEYYFGGYDATYYADGSGGSYESISPTSGYYWPSGWAFSQYFFNTAVPNTYYSYYDEYGSTVYPWTWGYTAADGMNGTYFNATGNAPSGTPASDYFTNNSYNYGRIYADGYGGYYFSS